MELLQSSSSGYTTSRLFEEKNTMCPLKLRQSILPPSGSMEDDVEEFASFVALICSGDKVAVLAEAGVPFVQVEVIADIAK